MHSGPIENLPSSATRKIPRWAAGIGLGNGTLARAGRRAVPDPGSLGVEDLEYVHLEDQVPVIFFALAAGLVQATVLLDEEGVPVLEGLVPESLLRLGVQGIPVGRGTRLVSCVAECLFLLAPPLGLLLHPGPGEFHLADPGLLGGRFEAVGILVV